MQAPVNHIIGLTSIVRERQLPISGTVIARVGQKVSSGDVVAETNLAREHVLLDVARALRVSPTVADSLVKFKLHDRIAASAEIAVGKGLFPRSVRAPREGRVVAVGGGQVLMEVGETKMELRAGIPGTIIELLPNRGVVIQTAGALIQGVWGNGRVDSGLLMNLAEKPDSILTASRLDVSMRGTVILAGIVKDADALQAAADLPVRGLILSSLYPSLLQLAREMRYPIMVTDGFGPLPMNSAAYKLLSTNAKRDVTVNAEVYDRYTGARPEVIIPLPIASDPPPLREVETFAPGLQVRMRRPPALGMIGSIVLLKPGLTTLPSGLRAFAAEVKLENGETVVAPLVNLEVVG
ncbi:MAG: hypothetical protein IPN96_22665 [Anaerolineales bacterium]|nr:hypothetical protein [Anaerolineales bacterium]MBK8822647.1 hypothetical protein [Anaerolineales bacterium]